MEESNKTNKLYKKSAEIKTYAVPFTHEEIKKNIIIITNNYSQTSKEQILNQAFKFHAEGNIEEATKYYKNCINQRFNDYRVYSNYGVILQNLGKLKEAEISLRKSIELNPYFADAHYNLGGVLKHLGKLQEAEISLRKSIELNPYFADAHYNLGGVLKNLNNIQGAFSCYMKVIDINPLYSNIYLSITLFLKESDLSKLNKSKLKKILTILLDKNNIPHQELSRAFDFLYSNQINSNIENSDFNFYELDLLINDKIIINALKKIIFCDLKLETLLTQVRRNICYRIAKNTEPLKNSELKFIIALGEQCFLNEYVYSFKIEEKISVNKIIQKCKEGQASETTIAILSCYFPLYKLIDQIPYLKSFNSFNKSFTELITLQILEPLKEIEISKKIKKLGSINDKISKKVKSQYEENPYPRWRYGNYLGKQNISISKLINDDIKPNTIISNAEESQLNILVAGCGTGQQILHTQIYKNAKITGIDFSLKSLSYAQRKIKELKINNVKLIEMDILNVNLLEEKFDIILCSGVLHHMDNPSKGLKALVGILKKNGFLKLGLYSELARKDIVEARNYIAKKNLQVNDDIIRNFRERVISGKLKSLYSLTALKDFYSLSEFRDLCFHTKEHRFTIQELQKTLKSNKLKFLGFLLGQQVKSLYMNSFPEDTKLTNLQNWAIFEAKHPKTFRAMYQFWVCKM